MTKKEFEKIYWSYYLKLENRFIASGDYVTFDTNNYSTYSNELVAMLQITCSEIDAIFKDLCGYRGNKNKSIKNYSDDILEKHPKIQSEIVYAEYFNDHIKPFENLSSSLPWWQNYNAIKHDRIGNMISANLETVLHALSALFLLNRVYLREIDGEGYYLVTQSRLFRNCDWDDQGPRMKFTVREGHPAVVIEDDDD